MKKLWALGFACSLTGAASAVVYDNFGSWDGSITSGWLGQAEKFVVPAVDNTLISWKSEFDADMAGLPVGFSIMDVVGGVPGGTTYFSSSAFVPGGGGTITFGMSVPLVSGSTYAAVWDFNGYSGKSIHYTATDVVPGNGMWWDGGTWNDFPTLDQELRAEFVAPEPCSFLVVAGALALVARRRRR